jgi:hypothetical protein
MNDRTKGGAKMQQFQKHITGCLDNPDVMSKVKKLYVETDMEHVNALIKNDNFALLDIVVGRDFPFYIVGSVNSKKELNDEG